MLSLILISESFLWKVQVRRKAKKKDEDMSSNPRRRPVENWPYLEDILDVPEGMLYHSKIPIG